MVKMKKHPVLEIMIRSDGMVLIPSKSGHPEHWTKGCKDGRGYYRIGLNSKTYTIHRLVAETFIENIGNLKDVDHIDRDKSNNNVENLHWVDKRQNLYNRSNTNEIGRRAIDMSKQEYKNMYLRKWRAKNKEKK